MSRVMANTPKKTRCVNWEQLQVTHKVLNGLSTLMSTTSLGQERTVCYFRD